MADSARGIQLRNKRNVDQLSEVPWEQQLCRNRRELVIYFRSGKKSDVVQVNCGAGKGPDADRSNSS